VFLAVLLLQLELLLLLLLLLLGLLLLLLLLLCHGAGCRLAAPPAAAAVHGWISADVEVCDPCKSSGHNEST
jgi:hypothetical protein